MRAPTTGTWKTQSVSPSLSRSLRRLRGQGRASSRPATSSPPPQPPRARARGVLGLGTTPRPARTAAPAEAGRARIKGSSAGSSLDPRGEPAGLEKGRPEERQSPLLVRLHLLHVAHNAPAKAPGGEEPNVPHRDRGFAPTPLPWILVFLRCANKIQPRCKLFAPSFQTLLQSKFRAIGGREKKKGGKSGAKSPADEHSGVRGWGRPPFQKRTRSISFFSMNWRPKRQRLVSFPGR
ncbi:uncharacterized protein LOC123389459 [Mustela putorius furo]|uniref:Uncharacterized protein LOC123389459 n=1 Tax=Mustela putorius furo TaxID=9669 RepID=A0A8U0RLK2_MUSPF|nr:uncharacterized protein LOC123389459 [Mustela putorius furo]